MTVKEIQNAMGVICRYFNVQLPKDEFWQECVIIFLEAKAEFDPNKGQFNTCLGKVARRRNMQLLRETVYRKRERKAEEFYAWDKYKHAKYPESCTPSMRRSRFHLEYPEQLEDVEEYGVRLVSTENKPNESDRQ